MELVSNFWRERWAFLNILRVLRLTARLLDSARCSRAQREVVKYIERCYALFVPVRPLLEQITHLLPKDVRWVLVVAVQHETQAHNRSHRNRPTYLPRQQSWKFLNQDLHGRRTHVQLAKLIKRTSPMAPTKRIGLDVMLARRGFIGIAQEVEI